MNRTLFVRSIFAATLVIGFAGPVWAQAQAPEQTLPAATIPAEEAAALAQGWVLLAEGKHDEAARAARSALNRFPRNVSALMLAVEADIARGGAAGALGTYEAWLGARPTEAPGVLRRVARAYLYEWGRQTGDTTARIEALLALAEDGDTDAQAVIAAVAGDAAQAKAGNTQAVDRLSARLKEAQGLKLREIAALADSGSARAIAPLVAVLKDARPENRAAAAEALGEMGDVETVTALKPLLNDPHGAVRIAAAGALFRLGDSSGAPLLEELAASEHASVRRSAAALMASQPDEGWKALVRGLASDSDPSIRLDAAKLLAPHDPEFARAIFERLSTDPNLAIREETALAMAEAPIFGLPELRKLLRTGGARAKVRAADRILILTR